jgi:hypothetical protein
MYKRNAVEVQILSALTINRRLCKLMTKCFEYIDKANSKFKKRLLSRNKRMYKTPLSITLTILKVEFSDLEKILFDAYEENKRL